MFHILGFSDFRVFYIYMMRYLVRSKSKHEIHLYFTCTSDTQPKTTCINNKTSKKDKCFDHNLSREVRYGMWHHAGTQKFLDFALGMLNL